ncbi:MAG: alpha-L-rhamnosidase [Clostridia bacterium]|nr:alpha-L-rhamnosidase [Clostridia bacterium]
MNLSDRIPGFKSKDDRARYILAPERILLVRGEVENASSLLEKAVSQTPMKAALAGGKLVPPAILRNKSGQEKAGVLLDFGRELHGSFRFYAGVASLKSGERHAKVLVRLGESASEALTPFGVKNAGNDHALRDHVYTVPFMSATETGESGFRFAYIELQDEEGELPVQSAEATLIFYDMPETGVLHTSDPLVDKIYDTAAWTLRMNLQRYLWDGIKRDRLVWAGDLNTEVKTCLALFGDHPTLYRSLDYARDTTPEGGWMNGYSSYSMWWVICQYDLYLATGNMDYLKTQKKALKGILRGIAEYIAPDGREELPPYRFMDWPNLANAEATHAGLQGLLRLGYLRGEALMEALGDPETASFCREKAALLARHKPDPARSKQAASFLALADLGDPGTLYREVIGPGGAKGYSTFLGYYTLKAAALAGEYDAALKTMKDYWGGMIQMGATSFFEDFDIDWMENSFGIDSLPVEGKHDLHGDFGGYCYRNFRHSLCHGWASGPVPYLQETLLGVAFLEPGGKKVRIAPHLSGLAFAEGSVPTPYGVIRVRHEATPDGVRSEISLPEGVEAAEE